MRAATSIVPRTDKDGQWYFYAVTDDHDVVEESAPVEDQAQMIEEARAKYPNAVLRDSDFHVRETHSD
jgi:hypothetical protein